MRVIFFADASPQIGMGHATRSFVLASELAAVVESTIVVGSLVSRAKTFDPSFQRVPMSETPAPSSLPAVLPRFSGQDFAVVDGYHYSHEFFDFLRDSNVPYGIIDDNLESSAPEPLFVLNHGLHAGVDDYKLRWPGALPLIGAHYALIRDGIRGLAQIEAHRKEHVVVALGGTDPLGRSAPVAIGLANMGFQPKVYLGDQCQSLRKQQALLESRDIRLHDSLDGLENALAEAQFAVVGAGTLLWETLSLGTKVIPTISADNQVGPAYSTVARGLAPALIDLRISGERVEQDLEEVVGALHQFEATVENPFQERGQENVVSALRAHQIIGS